MGIPSSQSSSPRPIVRFLELFQQRSSGTTLARRFSTLAGLVTPLVYRYPTAPCDHQRYTRAIGSTDASKCWEKKRRMGTGTEGGWRTIFCNSRISRGQPMATHQSKAQKETVSRVMHEFSTGSSKAVAGEGSGPRSRRLQSGCARPALQNTRASRKIVKI